MTDNKIFIIMLLVTIIHFILTSVIGHYIAVKTGTQIGQIVASGLVDTSPKSPEAQGEEAAIIYQNMKKKRDDINEHWKIPSLLISLPAKPIMNSFLVELRRNQFNKVISKELTKKQFYTHGKMIEYTANFVNSLSLGLIVYLILRIVKSRRKRDSDC